MRSVVQARELQALAVRRPLNQDEMEVALATIRDLVDAEEFAAAFWIYHAIQSTYKRVRRKKDGSAASIRRVLEAAAVLVGKTGRIQKSHRIESLPQRETTPEQAGRSVRQTLRNLFPANPEKC